MKISPGNLAWLFLRDNQSLNQLTYYSFYDLLYKTTYIHWLAFRKRDTEVLQLSQTSDQITIRRHYLLEKETVDLTFLDISIPHMSGVKPWIHLLIINILFKPRPTPHMSRKVMNAMSLITC